MDLEGIIWDAVACYSTESHALGGANMQVARPWERLQMQDIQIQQGFRD